MSETKTKTISFGNIKDLKSGSRVAYGDRIDVVKFDVAFNGGYKIGGRSIMNVLEEYGEITDRPRAEGFPRVMRIWCCFLCGFNIATLFIAFFHIVK